MGARRVPVVEPALPLLLGRGEPSTTRFCLVDRGKLSCWRGPGPISTSRSRAYSVTSYVSSLAAGDSLVGVRIETRLEAMLDAKTILREKEAGAWYLSTPWVTCIAVS